MMRKLLIVICLVFPVLLLASDSMQLTAEVDNPNPQEGERLTYTVTANYSGSLPDIVPPDFEGFQVVSGPSVTTSVQIINMAVSKSQTLTYIIRPQKSGVLKIAPATLKQKSRTISSNSVTVNVLSSKSTTNPVKAGKGASSPGEMMPVGKLPEVFVAATVDKSTLSKLDMATVTYKLYLRVNVLNYEITKLPQATGFWTEDFPTSSRPILEDVTIRGQAYKSAIIRKTGIFPTRAGSLILDPLSIDVTVERPYQSRRSRDPFDSFFDDPFSRGKRITKTVTCDPLSLTVLDFPAGAPATFSGDVGDFDMNVSYDRKELAQNDALTVKVTISGRGYLKSVDAPKLELPSGFEQFAPTAEDNINLVGETMRGKKSFSYLVIPRRSGSFNLPPVKFSYLDPVTRTYKTVTGGGLALNVTPSIGRDEGSFSTKYPSEVTLIDSDIRFVKGLTSPLTQKALPPYGTTWFFILLALSPLAYLGGIGWEKYSEARLADPAAVRRRRASEKMRKALLEANKLAHQGDALRSAETAAKGLEELVGAIILEPATNMSIEIVRKGLADRKAEEALVDTTVRLLGEADKIRFGGAGQTVSDISAMVDKFRKTAESLEQLR